MITTKPIFDITIIGAGPVGLFTAFYAQMRNAKVKIIDSLEIAGGQPTHLYGEKTIYDIPGFPAIKGQDLGQQLMKQLDRFNTTFCLGEEALNIIHPDHSTSYFEIQTNQATHYSKTIIIAAGNGAFQPRKLNIAGADQFEKSNLHYLVTDIQQYRDQTVAICGGGDSAVDWALALEKIAKKVYIIHRRDKFRALEHSVSLLKKSSVECITPYLPKQLIAQNGYIQQLVLEKAKSTELKTIDLDHLIVNYGFSTSIGSIKEWGLEIAHNQIQVDHHLETNIKGIFAVGDIADYEGKVRIIASGFGEAPFAVNHALAHVNPEYKQSPLHSTSLFEGE